MKFILKMKKQLNRYGQIIAITGGIGAGKSFILRCFRHLGFITYSFDQIIADMYKKGGSAYQAVATAFPECTTPDMIDKQLLAKKVFSNKEDLIKLESIVHPIVREDLYKFVKQIKKHSKTSIVVEVPLLFETAHPYGFDITISAIVNKETQLNRVLQRKNMTIDKFNAIVERQTTDNYRIKNSDFIIDTGVSMAHTFKQIKILVYGRYKRNSIRYGNHRP
ncbi:dephospho-CoA kinase [endosymbiont of Acanthamoeba sp. UWC8]|nr:dephospho-CoA kinase [endosymbiont of Acanthamoeba sp. UWC8]